MMQLKTLSVVKSGKSGEILICEDIAGKNKNTYTVLTLEDHEAVHSIVSAYAGADYIDTPTYYDMFSEGGRYYIVYPYVHERPLYQFYRGDALSLAECEEICINLIVSCMTSNLPWQLLYLVLKQRQIHLAADRSISLGYCIDLSEFDENVGEMECVRECAKILLDILSAKADRRANSYILLQKKTERNTYYHFTELYKDVRAAMTPKRGGGILLRIKLWAARNKDTIFRVLFRVSIVLAIFVVVTFLTNLIFGDVPWLRLFIRSFERIGLESLTQ